MNEDEKKALSIIERAHRKVKFFIQNSSTKDPEHQRAHLLLREIEDYVNSRGGFKQEEK